MCMWEGLFQAFALYTVILVIAVRGSRKLHALNSESERTNALIDWKLHLNLQVPLSVFAWTERR